MNPDISSGIRSFLKLIGSALATYGAIDAADVATLVNVAEIFFCAAFALGGVIWSIWSKRPKSEEARQVAAAVIVGDVPIAREIAEKQAAVVAAALEPKN